MKHFVHNISQNKDVVVVQGTTLLDHADLAEGPVFQLRRWCAEVSQLRVKVENAGVIARDNLDNMMALPGDGPLTASLAKAFWR